MVGVKTRQPILIVIPFVIYFSFIVYTYILKLRWLSTFPRKTKLLYAFSAIVVGIGAFALGMSITPHREFGFFDSTWWNYSIYLGYLFPLYGIYWIYKKRFNGRSAREKSVQLYADYLKYIEAERDLAADRKILIPGETFPQALAFDEWKKIEMKSPGLMTQLFSEYKSYLRSQKFLEGQKKVSYETFPPPLSFEEWKKQGR